MALEILSPFPPVQKLDGHNCDFKFSIEQYKYKMHYNCIICLDVDNQQMN
uniref:Uncharacterized protein n=1 Tax=Arundo donax TaxID=35708 RepID=A0A0A9GX41_ARUDO